MRIAIYYVYMYSYIHTYITKIHSIYFTKLIINCYIAKHGVLAT